MLLPNGENFPRWQKLFASFFQFSGAENFFRVFIQSTLEIKSMYSSVIFQKWNGVLSALTWHERNFHIG